ncbi:hypothetical protein MARCHEWKA_03050 [Brevundimonas phage vB_BpoS-Marchewka]|uniref:Uncharacterized protein n=1 Tax=Brevundimonas phage vB_BpoS-Marchewka TaxID=2948604 RepID=A0A9E7N5A8_9CAUD|nr:hypothetical protein MARCHEWKA_03050 [Brevundimonas phage vB_BpoS-Marchewka]UTC29264.1 hypothetical protein BAMBUS_01820 [Brevundimonas phage vB_BpoS-Bambus]
MPIDLKRVEKLRALMAECDAASSSEGLYAREVLALFVLEHREAVIAAMLRPPAAAGPALVETLEQVIYHHFYPGPLGGSKTRLANALIDAFPALQGHEA